MLNLRRIEDVSHFKKFYLHHTCPYAEGLFAPGDKVVATAWVWGVPLIIGRDIKGDITITNGVQAERGYCIGEHFKESLARRLGRWLVGGQAEKTIFWKAARASGIVGMLEHWPPIGADIQIFTQILAPWREPYQVMVHKVLIDGVSQGYHTFFPSWVPLIYWGAWNKELLTSLKPHNLPGKPRIRGIVVEHQNLKYTATGNPIIVRIPLKVTADPSATTRLSLAG